MTENSDGKIHLRGKVVGKLQPGQQPLVKLTAEAYNVLVDIVNETSMSKSQVVSQIIIQSQGLIVFDKPDNEKEE